MSIVRQLLVIAIVEALRNRTMAGPQVFDSTIDTLDRLRSGESRPLLIFSVEEAEHEPDRQADSGFIGRAARLKLLVQAVIVSGREIRDAQGVAVVASVGETDAAYEARLNLLDRQWKQLLHDHDGEWAAIFRGLLDGRGIGTIRDMRAVDPETGGKQALRLTEVSLSVMPDPLPGEPIPAPIERGLAAMESDGDAGYALVAAQWRQILGETGDWPDWRALQSALFETRDGMAALGQGPFGIDELVDFETARVETDSGMVLLTEADDVDH